MGVSCQSNANVLFCWFFLNLTKLRLLVLCFPYFMDNSIILDHFSFPFLSFKLWFPPSSLIIKMGKKVVHTMIQFPENHLSHIWDNLICFETRHNFLGVCSALQIICVVLFIPGYPTNPPTDLNSYLRKPLRFVV